ncbi:MAG: type I DNA topoisomerase [Chloroflexota bacterium]
MTKNLVIVESPAKARTIERYLGKDYKVLASYGHVRDLPENPGKGQFGVDVEHDFAPVYVVSEDRRRQLAAIEKEAGRASTVFLATDLDREGEAIAWHVREAAGIPATKARRVTFNEITEGAIRAAFAAPRALDMHLVDAQQARRIVDRLVGYTLSPLISRKVRGGLSAGRVQSVAVRLVVERERAIAAFVPREYWTIAVELATADGAVFSAKLVAIDGRPLDQGGEASARAVTIGSEAEARARIAAILAAPCAVRSVDTSERKVGPRAPFTTSTLQQEASRKLGFSPKRTMAAAQRLYEGIEIDGEPVGLTTYMRTDSVSMAGVAMGEARDVIRGRFGEQYTMPKGRPFRTKAKGAQEAHEAIRPTSFARTPESLRGVLRGDDERLYRLIWQRALASQMADRRLETRTAEIVAGEHLLRASATRTLFDGFAAVYTETLDDTDEEAEGSLPELAAGQGVRPVGAEPARHETQPPPRFTEASLIKALEEHGIGRPSTYAATIGTIVERGYVRVTERRLFAEPVAEVVTDLLVTHFPDFVDTEFTARMEKDLDEVAHGKRDWVPLLRDFYGPLRDLVSVKKKELKRADFTTEATDEVCTEGHPMVIRLGRNGRFLACSLYPEHRESRPLPGEEPEPVAVEGAGEACPGCGQGTLVAKRGRFGPFAGCDRYPECGYIHRTGPPPPEQLPYTVACPVCRTGTLKARRARRDGSVFWGCSAYPRCRATTSRKPLPYTHGGRVDDPSVAACGGPVAEESADAWRCLTCNAPIVPAPDAAAGAVLAGGAPEPEATARRGRPRATGSRSGTRTGGGAARAPRRPTSGTRSARTPRKPA